MESALHIFGYGSLIFAPELPEALLETFPATLPGYVRSFNKRSRARSCPVAQSHDAFPQTPPAFRAEGAHLSLALGTLASAHDRIDGVVQVYPRHVEGELLERLDAREGYVPSRAGVLNGYTRTRVRLVAAGASLEAITYLSNPDPANPYFVGPEVDIRQRAMILINATPRLDDGDKNPRARGLYYLEGTRRGLRQVGVVDPKLEALAAQVRALEGPWTALVAPPA